MVSKEEEEEEEEEVDESDYTDAVNLNAAIIVVLEECQCQSANEGRSGPSFTEAKAKLRVQMLGYHKLSNFNHTIVTKNTNVVEINYLQIFGIEC